MGRFLEIVIAIFLLTHIPITIFADSQAVFSSEWYHPKMLEATEWYLRTYHDPLMTPPHKPWFLSLVYMEIFLQLPFFFIGTYAFLARKNWIRIPALMYGTSVVTTMVPILVELWSHSAPGYNPTLVTAFYAPYLLIPLLIVLKTAFTAYPFGQKSAYHGNTDSLWGPPPNKTKWV